jgi:hypothetical protein
MVLSLKLIPHQAARDKIQAFFFFVIHALQTQPRFFVCVGF